jgi:hypothetical protein
MPKEIKIKLGGHDGEEWSVLQKRLSGFIPWASAIDKRRGQKMRKIRTLSVISAESVRMG